MNYALRPTAKTFIPGNKLHIIKKVKWHVKGITCIKYFNILDDIIGNDTAFSKKRQFLQTPKSNIRNSDENEAVPFKIEYSEKQNKPILVRQGPVRYNYCNN